MACNKSTVLSLYRNLIRESKKWKSYNYRMYALRKVKHEFQQNKMLKNQTEIEHKYNDGLNALEVIKRQVIIGNFYESRPLIIETEIKNKDNNDTK